MSTCVLKVRGRPNHSSTWPALDFEAHLSRNSDTPMGALGVLRLEAGVLPGGLAAPGVLGPPSLQPAHPRPLSRRQSQQCPRKRLTIATNSVNYIQSHIRAVVCQFNCIHRTIELDLHVPWQRQRPAECPNLFLLPLMST